MYMLVNIAKIIYFVIKFIHSTFKQVFQSFTLPNLKSLIWSIICSGNTTIIIYYTKKFCTKWRAKKIEGRRTYDLITPDSIFTTKLPHIVSETALPSLHLNCLGINHKRCVAPRTYILLPSLYSFQMFIKQLLIFIIRR